MITTRDLKEYNIIFIGYYRAMGVFEWITQKMSFTFDFEQKLVLVKSDNPDSVRIYKHAGSFKQHHEDYCLVYKLPGPNNNIILIISSFSATGTRGAVKFLTNSESLLSA